MTPPELPDGAGVSSGVRSIARNAALLAASQAVGIVARLGYVVLVARLLGPELYALLAYSQAWSLAFLPIAMYGRGIVVHTIARDPNRAEDVAAQTLGIRVLACTVAALACAMLAWLIPGNADAAPLITVLCLALTGRAVTLSAQDFFTTYEVAGRTLRQETFFRLLEMAAAAAILLSGGGLVLLLATHGLVWWLQAAHALHAVNRDLVPLRIALRPAEWLPSARLAQPFFLLSIAAAWRQDGPLILFRNLAQNDTVFGQFALSMQVLMVPAGLSQSLASAAQPVVTRAALRGDGKDMLYAGTVLRGAILLGGLAGLAGLALGPLLFGAIFGQRFAMAGELVGPALFCLAPMVAGSAMTAVVLARGHFRAATLSVAASAIALTALVPVLTAPLGAWGAVAAVGLAHAVTPAIAGAYARARGWHLPPGVFVRPILAVAVGTAACLALARWSAVLSMLAGLLALTLATAALRVFTRNEIATLLAAWRERGGVQVE